MSLLGPQTSSAESCCNLNMHDRNLHGARRGDKESLENEEKTNKKTGGGEGVGAVGPPCCSPQGAQQNCEWAVMSVFSFLGGDSTCLLLCFISTDRQAGNNNQLLSPALLMIAYFLFPIKPEAPNRP